MQKARILNINGCQTLELPSQVTFPDGVQQVEVVVKGKSRIITPVGATWDDFFHGEGVSEDFMVERDQPTPII
ncbi:MAG: type II toxin-antitoxin system VapB family antitoxin [Gammaproteobacteria bacterium]|nr:type II toxin-antitoxin system VapB family antitoxin [Gammaproteobacteria bacterium]